MKSRNGYRTECSMLYRAIARKAAKTNERELTPLKLFACGAYNWELDNLLEEPWR